MLLMVSGASVGRGDTGGDQKGGSALPPGLEAMLAGATGGFGGANPFGLSDDDLKVGSSLVTVG
jgi:hypothetical protein